jgi:putative spermidine/putrescine transport system substrate-binding protein
MNSTRRLPALAALGAAALLLSACGSSTNEPDGSASASGSTASSGVSGSLTFVNWGGDSVTAATKGWLEPFTAETGVTFQTDSPGDQAKVKAMVESGNVTWDVIDYDVTAADAECGTLYEERPADFDMSQIDPKYVTSDCGLPIIAQTVALVYNAEKFGDNPPTSITDFMDTATYPGKRILFNYWTGSVEPLLMADGVAAEDLYPLDWDRLFAMKDKLGSDLVFQSTLDQQVQAQESGDFALCLCYLGRSAVAAQNGANIGVVWKQTFDVWDGLYVVKGTKNPDAAWAFSQWLATPEGQAGYSKYLAYGPTTVGGPPLEVPAEFEGFLSAFNQDKIEETGIMDAAWYAANIAEVSDQWAKLTAG